VRRGEIGVVIGACLFFFCLLACNYILRPLREERGISGGPDKLKWLYTGTLAATLVLSPLFAWLVSRTQRKRFIAVTYRCFALSLVLFYVWLSRSGVDEHVASYTFFIWFSAFNLLVVAVFWGFMGDILANEQAKRLYGLIGAGGTLGAIAGSSVTKWVMSLERHPDPVSLLFLAALMIELCVQCMNWIARIAPPRPAPAAVPEPERPDALTGLRLVASRPYLRILCVYMVLQTICATFLYQQRGFIVDAEITAQSLGVAGLPDAEKIVRGARTEYFADIDLWVNVISLSVQIFFTGRLMKSLGVKLMLLPLPMIAFGAFAALGAHGSLLSVKLSMILSRAAEFAGAKPARETLYTVVSRAEKYQAKSFIDTFVYRGGDLIGVWAHAAAKALSSLANVPWVALPVAAAWLAAAFTLGRRQEALAKAAAALESSIPPG